MAALSTERRLKQELAAAREEIADLKSKVYSLEAHKREGYHVFRVAQIERDAWHHSFDALMEHHRKVYRE